MMIARFEGKITLFFSKERLPEIESGILLAVENGKWGFYAGFAMAVWRRTIPNRSP